MKTKKFGTWVAVKSNWTDCPIGNPVAIVGGKETYERRAKPGDHGVQYCVGEVSDHGPYGDAKVKAFAHLIAAAPDLYAVCLEILDHLGDQQCPLCFAFVADEGHDETCVGHRAEVAIEKARGEK